MANTAAAKKAMRASARRAVRNRSERSAVKTRVTRVRRAVGTESAETVQELALDAVAGLDRAAAKGVLHRNNAARRKSRLQKRVNEALAGVVHTEPAKGTRRGAAATAKSAAKTPATKAASKPAAKSAGKAPAKKAPARSPKKA